MRFYQVQAIEFPKVQLLDISNRRIVSALITNDCNGDIHMQFANDVKVVILGVHRDTNDLAPVSVGGMPYVYSDENKQLLSPMEDKLEHIIDPKSLALGNYLVCD